MKHTDFRDVPDELWERIEPLLAPSNEQRALAVLLCLNERFLPEAFMKVRADVSGPMLIACYDS